jgi:glycosyltransferase involved in cell wall biosynthesis
VRLVVYLESPILGGAEIVTGHLIEALRSDVEVVVMGPSEPVVEYLAGRRPGSEAVVLPPLRSTRELSAFAAHVRALRARRPAVFHAVLTDQTACQWPLIAAWSVRGMIPVAVEHTAPHPDTRRGRAAVRRIQRVVAAHVAVGRDVARSIEAEYGLPHDSVETIPNAVPDVPIVPMDLDAGGLVYGTASRFDPEKGLDVLVRSATSVPDATLFLLGGGKEAPALRRLVDDLGLGERVRFIDWSDAARRYLAAFDVVVVPSRAEAFGLTALEAMLAERPVVASAVGGLPELVEDGTTGYLVPPDDPDALAEALRGLLGDPDRRRAMGAAGRARAVEQFSMATMTRSYEALYDRLVAAHAA